MSSIEHGRIAFGPGGQILDVPENRELLEILERTPALPAEELIELGNFYRGYPTNVPLGDHIVLVGLATAEGQRFPIKNTLSGYGEFLDQLEDAAAGGVDDEGREDSLFSRILIRRVPVAGIGLLVETLSGRRSSGTVLNFSFVIGVAPAV
jgi:hypothetical protein